MTYSVKDLVRFLEVKPHVLRYWEQSVPFLSGRKSLTGYRLYSESDLRILLRLKYLITEKKFTLEGACEKLWQELNYTDPDLRVLAAEAKKLLLSVKEIILKRKRKMMELAEQELKEKMIAAGQGHLFTDWAGLSSVRKKAMLADLNGLDLEEIEQFKALVEQKQETAAIAPLPYAPYTESSHNKEAAQAGEEYLRRGKTCFLMVAGGQGSRLGFDGPKGCFKISPLREVSLFQIFAEKRQAAQKKYKVPIPWYIMTSPQNHCETVQYFEENNYFGDDKSTVIFFQQGTLPSLSTEFKLLVGEDGRLFKNPDGHGGLVRALHKNRIFTDMSERGLSTILYFQIDNPLVNVPDSTFLGYHLLKRAEVSTKVIPKLFPEEKLGVIGKVNGKPGVIEYSDLDPINMYAQNHDGTLQFLQGSIAIHIFNLEFLRKPDLKLPFHTARKRIKCLKTNSEQAEIIETEGIKFEMFIFDAIPQATRALFYETRRSEEFAPLKNKTGGDSIQTCREGQVEKAALYLEESGIKVPRDKKGKSIFKLEISPLYAPDLESFQQRMKNEQHEINQDSLFI